MVQTIPEAVPSLGTRRVVFIPGGVANLAAIKLTEVTAAKNISCYLTPAGFNAAGQQAVIDDKRYCSAQSFERPGTESRTLEVEYVFNLKVPAQDEARVALKKGTKGTIVHFLQLDESATSFTTDDWYEAVNVEAGTQFVKAAEENAVDRIGQKLFVQSLWTEPTKLVAGP